jgi:hypothetical protein
MLGFAKQIRFSILGAAVFSMLASGTAVAADSCSFLGLDTESIEDGALFLQSTDGWHKVDGSEILNSPPIQSFAYAIRPFVPSSGTVVPKQGAIVIKSGTIRDSESPARAESVQLVRSSQPLVPCGGIATPTNTFVSWRSYADFHDFGREVEAADGKAIYDFHIRYLRNGSQCVSTADSSTQGVLSFDGRSNRSQFSFDPSVVAKGQYSQISSIFLARASAGFTNFANFRVEISGYDTKGEAVSCVRFSIPHAGAQTFMRIVDLEARDSRPPFPRLPEKAWEWHN